MEVTLYYPLIPIRYLLSFIGFDPQFILTNEIVERSDKENHEQLYHYSGARGPTIISVKSPTEQDRQLIEIERGGIQSDQSVLSQRRDGITYPELTYIAYQFERMRFYRELDVGREALVVSHVRNRRDRAGGVSFWRPEC